MAHGSTEHHLEHAEHVQHQAHDPFDRRVAMSMAILAAVLAGVTMQSHRAHNEVLKLQNEASQMMIKENDNITAESDKWGYYQAKKNRQYLYEALGEMLAVNPKDAATAEGPGQAAKLMARWKDRSGEYKKDAATIEAEARDLHEKAQEFEHKADEYREQAEHVHHRADRFDYGHFGLELALVLCSVAVLTKLRGFWFTGIGIGAIGALVAASGFLIGGH
jgi:hypothetical protein